jgi:hypothetical protein
MMKQLSLLNQLMRKRHLKRTKKKNLNKVGKRKVTLTEKRPNKV